MDVELLKSKFTRIRVRNMTNYAVSVPYASGDSVQVQPGEVARLSTAGMMQLPDVSMMAIIEPTIPELISAGVITPRVKQSSTSSPAAAQPVAAAPTASRKASVKPAAKTAAGKDE